MDERDYTIRRDLTPQLERLAKRADELSACWAGATVRNDVSRQDESAGIERDERGQARAVDRSRRRRYRVGVERAGRRHRIVQFLCWKPSTHEQAWLYAVLGIGVPGFIIWSIIEHDQLYTGAIYAASVTLVGGLAQSKQLNRRRREDR